MTIRQRLILSFFFALFCVNAQQVSAVYKISHLLNRISNPDTTYIINFWATWCKPCVAELPAFDSLYVLNKKSKVKIILVSLDFKEGLRKKINPFLKKHAVRIECVLLDEINGNDFINQISGDWSGAIPATLFRHGKKEVFVERSLKLEDLQKYREKVQ